MEKQNHIIEQVFKDAFDEFTPDVSPKVWSGISQQLAQPVVPSVQPSGSVAKVAVSKMSSLSTWIVGGIAAIAVTAGVIFYQNDKAANKDLVPISEVKVEQLNNEVQNPDAAPSELNQQQPTNNDKEVKSVLNTSTNATVIQMEVKKVVEEGSLTPGINSKPIHEINTTPSKAETNSNESALKVTESTITEIKTPNDQSSTNDNSVVNKVEPLILINTTAGFAPLQITGMLNQEKVSADWDFGDGSTQLSTNNITHKYIKPGTYKLACVAGEIKLAKTIEVIGEINTVFSPNGDGINDYFFVDANNLKTFSLSIFDRNGRKITELTNSAEKWDGKLGNGEVAPSGTYFFELTATTENSNNLRQRGIISLFK